MLYFFILLTVLGGVQLWFFWMDSYLERVRIGWGTFIYRDERPRLFRIIFTIKLLAMTLLALIWLVCAFELMTGLVSPYFLETGDARHNPRNTGISP
jgi:hypothetical protein